MNASRTKSQHRQQAAEALLTPAEVATYLRVSWRTLQEWRRSGVGPTWIRLGYNRVRYRKAEVEEWLNRETQVTHEVPR